MHHGIFMTARGDTLWRHTALLEALVDISPLYLPCISAVSPLLEALVVVQLDDLRGRYVQVLVNLAREVLVEQRLELAVLLLQLGDLVDSATPCGDERAVPRVRVRVSVRVRVRVGG